MCNILSILKVQFLSSFGLNGNRRSKKAQARSLSGKIGVLCLFAALFIYVSYTYTFLFGSILSPAGLIKKIVPFMVGVSCLIDFFFNFYTTSGILYNSKDYEMLISMPIKKSEIIIAKFAFMYITSFAFSLLITATACIVSSYEFGLEMSAGFIVRTLLVIIFSPLIPISIAIIVGLLISLVSSLFIKKNIIQLVGYLAFFIAIFVLSFMTGLASEEDADILGGTLGKLYFLMPLVERAVEDFLYVLIFIGISVVSFAVILCFVSKTYTKINAILISKKTSRNYKTKTYKGKSQFKALYKREFSRVFAYPMYAFNTIMGPIMTLVISIVAIFVIKSVPEIAEVDLSFLAIFLPAVFAFTCNVSPSTVSSVSIEGNTMWIIRTSPIPMEKVFRAKLAINNTFIVIPTLIASVLLCIAVGSEFLLSLFVVLSCVCIAVFGTNLGLFINILFPKMNWDNAQQVTKNSLASFVMVMLGMIFTGIIVVIDIYVKINAVVLMAILFAVILILTVSLDVVIMREGDELLRRKGY